jgi:hypothetical protein
MHYRTGRTRPSSGKRDRRSRRRQTERIRRGNSRTEERRHGSARHGSSGAREYEPGSRTLRRARRANSHHAHVHAVRVFPRRRSRRKLASWLGRQDSNLRSGGKQPPALPLSYPPVSFRRSTGRPRFPYSRSQTSAECLSCVVAQLMRAASVHRDQRGGDEPFL